MIDPTLRAQRFLACLSDPSRFRLLLALGAGDRCVTDLARAVGLSQSCTTRHLQALEREAAVESARQGKRVVYRIRGGAGTAHPVLRWALGAAADVEGDVTWATPNAGPADSQAAAHEGDGSVVSGRPSTRRRGRPRRAPGREVLGGPDLHRTVSGQATAWGYSDRPEGADPGPIPGTGPGASDASPVQPGTGLPATRRELDDFLL